MVLKWYPELGMYVDDADTSNTPQPPSINAAATAVGLTPGGNADQFGTLEGYDPEYDVATNTYNRGKGQAESDYTFGMGQVANQYTPLRQQLDQQNRDNILAAQRRAADNGIFYGTPALQGQQKVADQYQQVTGDLLRQRQSAEGALGQQRLGTLGNLETGYTNAGIRHADVVAQQRTARAAKEAQVAGANPPTPVANNTGQYVTGSVGAPPDFVPPTPGNMADNLYNDWSRELQNPNLSPLVLENARRIFQNILPQGPIGPLLSDPRFDIIRQRLGLA